MAIETELKYLLSRKAFTTLATALGRPTSVAVQTNVYFDTPNRSLARRGMAVRVRTVGAKHLLTVKRSTRNGSEPDLSVREEYECRMSKAAVQTLARSPGAARLTRLAPWGVLVDAIGSEAVRTLKTTARMQTRRSSYRMGAGILVELDEVTLPGGKQFHEVELECSSPRAARRFLKQLFASAGVRARPVRRTKLARVMSEMRK